MKRTGNIKASEEKCVMPDSDEEVIVMKHCGTNGCTCMVDLVFDVDHGEYYCITCRELFDKAPVLNKDAKVVTSNNKASKDSGSFVRKRTNISKTRSAVSSSINDGMQNSFANRRIVETISSMPPVVTRPFTDNGNSTFPQYVVGSSPQLESLLLESFRNKYRLDGNEVANYIVVQIHSVKWTSEVIYGRNQFIGCDVALASANNVFRGTALPGDVVIAKLMNTDTWHVSNENATDVSELLVDKRLMKKNSDDETGVYLGKKKMQNLSGLTHEQRPKYRGPAEHIHTELGLGKSIKDLGQWPTNAQPRATIEYVLQRGFQSIQACVLMVPVGQTAPDRIINSRYYLFKPYSEMYPVIAVYGCDIPSTFHDQISEFLFLVKIKSSIEEGNVVVPHMNNGKTPIGSVVSVLGKSGTVDAETKAIAFSFDVEDREFSEDEEACIVKDFSVPTDDVLSKMCRRDLRKSEFVCSIDPITARDLDDALSIEHNYKTGGCRIGVHIADVSFFVPVGSPLDQGARRRSTSVYFIERVIPMLPRKLSEDYCSLNAGVDKLAFSSIFELDRDGNIISEWFGQSVIRNRCRMSYEDAQRIIDGDVSGDSLVFDDSEISPHTELSREDMVKKVVKSIKELYRVASILREKRFNAGALSLNRSKIQFKFLEMDNRLAPSGIALQKSGEANWTVEEFMLLANIRTAAKSLEYLPDSSMLRRHPPPDQSKLTKFVQSARQHSYVINAGSASQLNQSLKKYEDDKNSDVLRLAALYCMNEAEYICSGEEVDSLSHYALACECYCHFTSPIRRYCDIVAHRQLLLALSLEKVVKGKIAAGMSAENAMRCTSLEDVMVDTSNNVDFHDEEYVTISLEGPPPVHRYYLHPNDVAAIAENANKRKRSAKMCSEASAKLFFILYIRALKKKALTTSGYSPSFNVRVVISKFDIKHLNLVAPEIAMECKILHNSNEQRWDKPNVVQDNSIFIHWGPAPATKKQQINEAMKVRDNSFTEGAVVDPNDTYEGEIEKVGLFSELIATLDISKRAQGITTLSMIILPPWNRTDIVKLLPATL